MQRIIDTGADTSVLFEIVSFALFVNICVDNFVSTSSLFEIKRSNLHRSRTAKAAVVVIECDVVDCYWRRWQRLRQIDKPFHAAFTKHYRMFIAVCCINNAASIVDPNTVCTNGFLEFSAFKALEVIGGVAIDAALRPVPECTCSRCGRRCRRRCGNG
jgi:hypothetical protein